MKNLRKYLPYIFAISSIILIVVVLYIVYHRDPKSNILKVVFLDVGQGDAIYIEAPNGRQMLIDAGPGPKILQKLPQVMPFADRSIDLILATHDDADHIGGFPYILDKYKVGKIIENGATRDTRTYVDLESKVAKNNIEKIIAHKGMHIMLDTEHNIYFDVLFPDRDVSGWKDSNDGSIVGKLVYSNESFMLTGDATRMTEYLLMEGAAMNDLHANVLKLGHHGSHTSSSRIFLEKVHPEISVISAGLHNRYGHPHQDVLDILNNLHIPYLATYQKGNITFKTDGLKIMY